uniref:Uncharacterized protein n=2 Tax=Anguilla anguilla TaxID=7936 RepID=A0A0E9QR71_ANGAN
MLRPEYIFISEIWADLYRRKRGRGYYFGAPEETQVKNPVFKLSKMQTFPLQKHAFVASRCITSMHLSIFICHLKKCLLEP